MIWLCLILTRKDQMQSVLFHRAIQLLPAENLQFHPNLWIRFAESTQHRRHPVFRDARVSPKPQRCFRLVPQKRCLALQRFEAFDIATQIRQQALAVLAEGDSAVCPLNQLHSKLRF